MSVGLHRRGALERLALVMLGASLATALSCTSPARSTPPPPTTSAPGSGSARGNPASYRTYQAPGGGIPRWDPCAPIHYVTNLAGAGYAGALADVQAAVAQVSGASGLTFQYDGEVGTRVSRQYGNVQVGGAWPPVLIAWARRSETDAYDGVSTPGATLAATHAWFRRDAATGSPVFVGGNIAVEPDVLGASRVVPGTGVRSVGVVVMHEVAHLVGLDHVNDQEMIMAPAISRYSTWGAGDLTGLQVVGVGDRCRLGPADPNAEALAIDSVPQHPDVDVISRVDAG
jgi:hypothetical protein